MLIGIKMMFEIKKLTNVGNIDMRQNPHEPLYGTESLKDIKVEKLSSLRDLIITYIDKYELGGGNFICPKVYKDGKYIGWFSYNGKFWREDI
jgi:hypothetical protein